MKAEAPDTMELLRGLSLFRRVGDKALQRIVQEVRIRQFPRNRRVFRRGEACQGLFVVVRGRVRVFQANARGQEQVIHDQGPGEALAEVPLFDGGPYPAHARAEEDSELLFLPRERFREVYRTEPDVAEAVILELGGRLRRAVSLISKISLRDVVGRVGLTLLDYADSQGAGKGDSFTLTVTQGQMAEGLATTRESVARALKTLREEGFIEQEKARVRILDPQGLEDRSYGV